MNLDLHFSEAQYGTLASVGFTALFAIASLFAGGLADRYDRKVLTIGSAIVWSIATFLTSISADYDQVLSCRILMGLACAFSTPSAYTLIRDLIPKDQAPFAISLYGSGIYVGGSLSSLSILLNDSVGWRGTLGFIGGVGIISAALVTTLLPTDPKIDNETTATSSKTPKTKDQSTTIDTIDVTTKKQSPISDVVEVLSIPRIRWLFLGSFLRFCSGLCIGIWSAPYYKLAFPDDAASYAVVNAFIVGLFGVSSGIFGGWAADKSATYALESGREGNVGRLAIPIIGSLLAVPAWYMTMHASSFNEAMIWLGIEYLVAECWFGPSVAVLQSEVKPTQGGVAQGAFTLTGALGNLAPTLLGVLYGQSMAASAAADTAAGVSRLQDGSTLSNLLSTAVCAGYFLSSLCFVASAAASGNVDLKSLKQIN